MTSNWIVVMLKIVVVLTFFSLIFLQLSSTYAHHNDEIIKRFRDRKTKLDQFCNDYNEKRWPKRYVLSRQVTRMTCECWWFFEFIYLFLSFQLRKFIKGHSTIDKVFLVSRERFLYCGFVLIFASLRTIWFLLFFLATKHSKNRSYSVSMVLLEPSWCEQNQCGCRTQLAWWSLDLFS